MSQPDSELKAQIAENLEGLGLQVTALEERDGQRTPDLLASSGDTRFLIEVKSKTDDADELALQNERAAQGEVGEWSEPWAPRNTVSRILRDGARQLAAFPEEQYDFALLWLHAEGRDPGSQLEQFRHTLYGLTRVFSLRELEFDHQCFFFHESGFFSLSDSLDGAIISTPTEAQLCLNTYSSRSGALRESPLARALAPGMCDPEALAEEGVAIIADFAADRRDSSKVIAALQEKYGKELLQHMHMGSLSAWVYVDEEA